MNMRDLIPWGRSQQTTPSRYRDEGDPFMTLHREMNRLFDDVFRGFDMAPFGGVSRMASWPHVEVVDNDKDVRISAELPGLEDKDVEVLIGDGVLTIRGEKKSAIEDKERAFSERTYGRFERRIPLAWEVEEDKIEASFKNGVLTVTLPKSAESRSEVKRIAVNRASEETKH
ncbi:MAG: Hsp20/alpha crystallin family protein [Microvirga sp.]|jgi:HSP20 family protein|uniref:Hsp20/alpha crystallin family protein n=1 Tax=Microvirga tunisiensis TaxID=2108360 RepID=A0A5N7MU40_9HYPH|nr:Hsp20/alpha crystallin family protein [Microvirga tunisiensis]MPR12588.1 Hsp20/alpha crystallin family protein [Microvirga tunisiensis]MPR30505.1 Hsp20/alpha crystallin family protein [Microvirga tunisiensis]